MLILFAMNPEQVFIVLFVSSGLYKSWKYLKLGNNSLKMSVLVYMNSEKYIELGNSSDIYEL